MFALYALCSMAQEEESAQTNKIRENVRGKKQYYLFSPRSSITVPHPMTNKAFKKCFVGIYEISAGLNVMFYKNFFIGGTYKNGLLKITGNKIPNFSFHNVSMEIDNLAIKMGGDGYLNDNNTVVFSASVSAGQNWTKFSGLESKAPSKHPLITGYRCTFVEPEVNLFFLVDPNFGIGATVSYCLFNKIFNPFELSLNDWTSFDTNNPGATSYLSFGFGFYYSFQKRKQ